MCVRVYTIYARACRGDIGARERRRRCRRRRRFPRFPRAGCVSRRHEIGSKEKKL